jgi:hypothetical protein
MLYSKYDKWITGYSTTLSQLLRFRSVECYDSVIASGEFAGSGKKATVSIF